MITTWLKFWADQADSRAERKQRLALIDAHFPHQRISQTRTAGRRSVRGSRPNCPMEALAS